MLTERGHTVATAESLTGGRLCAELVDIAGASAVVAGGVIAYSADAKIEVLGIDAAQICDFGTVSEEVACQMAGAARQKFDTTWAMATTGVAGPGTSEGKPVGRVHIAVAGIAITAHRRLDLARHGAGDRDAIRAATVDATLELLAGTLGNKD